MRGRLTVLVIVLVAVLTVGALWYYRSQQPPAPGAATTAKPEPKAR